MVSRSLAVSSHIRLYFALPIMYQAPLKAVNNSSKQPDM